MKNKHFVFLLPEYYEMPIDGYKVVFEYSNRLILDGNKVTIVYPYFLYFFKSSLKRKLKMLFFFFYYIFFKRKGVSVWFPLSLKVENKFVLTLCQQYVPQADFYIATSMETAAHLNNYNIDLRKKYYLIQALEDWQWGKEEALKTWKYKLNKIVVSPWLKSIAEELGEQSILIPNGVDRPGIGKYIDIKEKDKHTVMMLFHKQKLKGCDDGLEAIKIVKDKFPMLKSIWFGSPNKPNFLPNWITYYQRPENELLNKLYNEAGIFIGTSHNEGFGLTVGEAMSCGCAVACTSAGGYLTMAKNGETALVSEIQNAKQLAENIIKLLQDDQMRYYISQKGYEYIQMFTWNKAYEKFKLQFIDG